MSKVGAIRILLLSLSTSCNYISQITQWLDQSNVAWREVQLPKEFASFPSKPKALLELGPRNASKVALHLIPTPDCLEDCLAPYVSKHMTDLVSASFAMIADNNNNNNTTTNNNDNGNTNFPPKKVIHLHEDVWHAKTDIVKCRLMAQLGRSRRIFARKTTTRRINATLAMNFLQDNHLWGAIRAKTYYGLFLTSKKKSDEPQQHEEEGELVAVATFSARRKIIRNDKPHRSHELLRFCAQRDSSVVGGISKLIKRFVSEQSPDDIVTVVDRDWGDGSGWQSVGFESVATMAPIVMAVNPSEPGVRRHLVGASISSTDNASVDTSSGGRMGLPASVLQELNSIQSAKESRQCLARHDFFPVYDSGVERLMKLVPGDLVVERSPNLSVKEMWKLSKPTYTATYYSDVSGIASLLKDAESVVPPLDSEEELASVASWRATSGTAASARLVFTAPSSLDEHATVEVRERPNGWRTVGTVGGPTSSIYHAVYKVDSQGRVDPSAVVSETLKTMATLGLAALERRPSEACCTLRFLHYGFGAGTVVRLLAHHVVDSQHLAIELDRGVVAAAEMLPYHANVRLEVGDALAYQRKETEEPFDCIFIDIFDANNLLPKGFYSTDFLIHLRDNILGPYGVVVHNFHSGGKKRALQIEKASAAYSDVFKTCCWVDSLDSRLNAGNALLLASKIELSEADISKLLTESAEVVQRKWGLRFDAVARARGARFIDVSASSRQQ